MVIDSSALIALLLGEPETERFVETIATTSRRLLSVGSYLETAIVIMGRLGPDGKDRLDRLIAELEIIIVPFAYDQANEAIAAYAKYGKGRGQAANLNFGDCFTYALAKLTGESVLFKGNDFSHTDLASAILQSQ